MSKVKPAEGVLFEELLNRAPYIIEQLELYNWGPFSGLHRAEIDPRGSAIIGQTGSGKTTLVDAFMTLLAERPLYNLASTGGHESDRDLVSYIRGVAGEGNQSGDNAHIARSGPTLTALGARFGDGAGRVALTALFWLDGSSSSLSDLKRIWIFDRQPEMGIADWLELHREGGARAVKRFGKEQNQIQVYDSKKAYLAQVRRFFEVSETAFALLNRAAGLKQLNSIDALFRELVLEDRSAFQRAADVVEGFDVLKEIHGELEIARAQQQSLLPIEAEERVRQARQADQARLSRLQGILPVWFALQGKRLWTRRQAELDEGLRQIEGLLAELNAEQRSREARVDELHQRYIEQGGGDIELLEGQIGLQEAAHRERSRKAEDYLQLTRNLALDEAPSAAGLAANQRRGETLRVEKQQAFTALDGQRDREGGALFNLSERQREIESELREARDHKRSNLPTAFLSFKQDLAEALGIDGAGLAYVAELVEVKPEQQAWRGAIERAIGAHRLRLIVPGEQMQAVLGWVNRRDNRLHVRLLDAAEYPGRAGFLSDGFTHKLNYARHPLREALKAFLADIDRHCVATVDELHRTPHALTAQGSMSGRQGQFDKQDQRPLGAGWMTGFDNRDRLRELERELERSNQEVAQGRERYDEIKDRCRRLEQQIQLLDQLQQLQFSDIDLASVEADLHRLRRRLEQLRRPDSDAARAERDWKQAKAELSDCQTRVREQETRQALLQERRQQAAGRLSGLLKRIGSGLSPERQALGDGYFSAPNATQIEHLDELEREATHSLMQQLEAANGALSGSVNRLIRLMGEAQRKDTGALAEVGSEIRDIPNYLQRLELLTKEALPEKVERFLEYLNKSSDEGVTQLLAHIDNEVSLIEERIEEINGTMVKVDFQPGCYLHLTPRRVIHETLTSIHQAQKRLRSEALKDDQGESHYRALVELVRQLRDAVERRKTQGAKALLDPRYRLQFSVSVIERDGERVLEVRSGSQGGSGGEKEIIASYILTASLSYALCPDGLGRPLFGTVVLDEAFSKSSQAVAARIIEALRRFGLHPLFITPNKEMRLLRSHTRSAILVHRRGKFATTASLSWEELDRKASRHLERQSEKP